MEGRPRRVRSSIWGPSSMLDQRNTVIAERRDSCRCWIRDRRHWGARECSRLHHDATIQFVGCYKAISLPHGVIGPTVRARLVWKGAGFSDQRANDGVGIGKIYCQLVRYSTVTFDHLLTNCNQWVGYCCALFFSDWRLY
jgi:hypothetical protein